jgi:tripartite-type tricarboxylate transporter receptor subunit TctC
LRDFPDVPTFAELGYDEMTSVTWFGLSGPAGLPRDLVANLNIQIRAALAKPKILDILAADAIEPNNFDPEEFTQFFRAEMARWTPIADRVKKLGQPTEAK